MKVFCEIRGIGTSKDQGFAEAVGEDEFEYCLERSTGDQEDMVGCGRLETEQVTLLKRFDSGVLRQVGTCVAGMDL